MRVATHLGATVPVAFILALAAAGPAFAVEYCKWTDENGVVHYAEECPSGAESEIVATQDDPARSQLGATEEQAESLPEGSSQVDKSKGPTQKYRSLPSEKLGPLPPINVSALLKTTGADFGVNSQTLQGHFVLFLEARANMPEGAWVEAAFPNPSDIEKFDLVGKRVGPNLKFMLESPPTRDLKCWNYIVQLNIFSDSSKKNLIGTHRQVIQSQVNLDLVENSDDLLLGVTTGLCVRKDRKDFSRMSAEELEALCQKEREKRLAPQRERLIRDCVERQGKSREHCENYYADYGDAQRIGPGEMRPELYSDLPECAAAREAREKKRQ